MNFLQKILVVLFILISGSLKAGEITDLYENEEFDAAYRLGYAEALNGVHIILYPASITHNV